MMAGMAVHTVYMIADFAFIGTISDEAVAGVTLVGPLFFVIIALLNGSGTAYTALIAQALGREDEPEASRVASGSLGFSLLVGLLFMTAGVTLGPLILHAAGAQGAVHAEAWAYFRVIAFTVPLFFVSSALRAVLTGEGDTATPMIIMALSTVINLSLDWLFILRLGWGTAGAALATAAAQVFSLTLFIFRILVQRRSVVRFRLTRVLPHRALWVGLWVIGLPTAAGQLIMAAGAGANNRLLTEFGTYVVSGYGAASRVDMIVAMPIFGLAGAAVTLIGMFAGASRPDLVRSTTLYAYRWAVTMAVGVGIAAYLASEPILRLFVDDPEAVAIGRLYLGYMVFMYPMMAFGMTTGRILQGLGFGLPSLVVTFVRVLAIGVPIAYLAVYLLDAPVQAVWISIIVGAAASTVISVIWVRQVVWRRDPTVRARQPENETSPAQPVSRPASASASFDP
jgi:putative MATE family efflux protein